MAVKVSSGVAANASANGAPDCSCAATRTQSVVRQGLPCPLHADAVVDAASLERHAHAGTAGAAVVLPKRAEPDQLTETATGLVRMIRPARWSTG